MNVQSVIRAFDIVKTVANASEGLGVTEIAERTDLHKSTVSRLLTTLQTATVIQRDPDAPRYRISDSFAAQFTIGAYPQTLIHMARPVLVQLNARLGEAVGLVIPDGDYVQHIDQVFTDQAVMVQDWTGHRFPLHHVSSGWCQLACMTEAEQDAYFERWPQEKEAIIDMAQLRDSLAQFKADGSAWVFKGIFPALHAMAVPVMGVDNRPIAFLAVFGPAFRFPKAGDNMQAKISALLIKKSKELSEDMRLKIHKSI